jgi:aspartate-semialdehyde dehydrogenase
LAKALPKTELKLALVGGETLLGGEVRDVMGKRLPGVEITTFAASGEGSFDERDGEAVYVEALETKALRGTKAIVLAGNATGALKAYSLAKASAGKLKIIDCGGYLEDRPEARIAAPMMPATLPEPKAKAAWLSVTAHPAASAAALVLTALTQHRKIVRSVVEVFAPASEYGKRGISELHQQTTSLLAFKPLDKQVFDAQLSFNMLAQYGEEAPVKLAALEQRIETHIATILAKQAQPPPMPSLRVIQAPVFHGYSLSLWVEFASNVAAPELAEALPADRIDVRGFGEETPTGAEAAGQSGLIVGDIRVDRNNPRALWLWLVFDNLRVIADDAASLLSDVK